jgi:hypothetical protein
VSSQEPSYASPLEASSKRSCASSADHFETPEASLEQPTPKNSAFE